MSRNETKSTVPPPENDDLVQNARKALAMKESAPHAERPKSRTPGTGMTPVPNEATTHELSLQSEGVKPVMQPHKGR